MGCNPKRVSAVRTAESPSDKEHIMARFTGKTVIVTGASSGIGKGAAERFAEEGANIVAVGRDEAKVRDALAGLPQDRLVAIGGDVADKATAEAAVRAAVDRFGGVDVLVNNAGIATGGDVTTTGEQDFMQILAVNVGGYFHFAKAAMPELVKTKGSIVMTSSVSGLGGDWDMFAYNTSKGAVTNMVRAMAMDAGKQGVRVNAVNPSLTDSNMTKDMQEDETLMAKFMERMPLGRIARPDDIAAVMAFLASDDARFVTGVNLPVDGGLSASNGQPPQ
jgi:meso-butanediol dehydrogenase/(S,S)-butanediol dehydrogenase/diacetyl reductase